MEPTKIEPHYQMQAKQFVDSLFDLGMLSESLSRDGITAIEDLVALYFHQIGTSAAKMSGLSKEYKFGGKDLGPEHERHEEEKRWIVRAKEAEALVATLNIDKGKLLREKKFLQEKKEHPRMVFPRNEAWKWGQDVGAFLKKTLQLGTILTSSPPGFDLREASRLFTDAIELGIVPDPDIMPGKIVLEDEMANMAREIFTFCPESGKTYPGAFLFKCPKCGGWRNDKESCKGPKGGITMQTPNHPAGAKPTQE